MNISKEDKGYAGSIIRIVAQNPGQYNEEEIIPFLGDEFNLTNLAFGEVDLALVKSGVKMSINELREKADNEEITKAARELVDKLIREKILRKFGKEGKLDLYRTGSNFNTVPEVESLNRAVGRGYIPQSFAQQLISSHVLVPGNGNSKNSYSQKPYARS